MWMLTCPTSLPLDQRLLFAARTDNEGLFHEVVAKPGTYDVNFQDGLGNTALHYAAAQGSTTVLPQLLEEEIDVDLHNRLDGNTPLHEAVDKIQDEALRDWVGECSSSRACICQRSVH